jgi:SRSO17 transposase
MTGLSIEATLELWASSLRSVKERIRPLFTQDRVAASAGLFLDGLLGDERRKTGWMRAEAAGDPGPWRQQAILGRGRWSADALRDIVRDDVLASLADDDAVLVIDETGFLKQGKTSCGVGRQYTEALQARSPTARSAYLPAMCRIQYNVLGHAFIDRALYLPKAIDIKNLDGRSRSHGGSTCSFRRDFCDQANAGALDDRTGSQG